MTYAKPVLAAAKAEEDGNEGQPDDANGVHGEADMLRFVEVLRNLPSFDCIKCTGDDQQHVVDQRRGDVHTVRAAEENEASLIMLGFGFALSGRRVEQNPEKDADQLHADDASTDAQLRSWGQARGLLDALLVVEDAGEPVRFREKSSETDRQAEADTDANEEARHGMRLQNQRPGAQMARADAEEEEVAQLTRRRLDDRRVRESDEYHNGVDRHEQSHRGESDRRPGDEILNRQVLLLQGYAVREVAVRNLAFRARQARRFVHGDVVGVARAARPAALLRVGVRAYLAGTARLAAERSRCDRALRPAGLLWTIVEPFQRTEIDAHSRQQT